jgi:hypothetical protein
MSGAAPDQERFTKLLASRLSALIAALPDSLYWPGTKYQSEILTRRVGFSSDLLFLNNLQSANVI